MFTTVLHCNQINCQVLSILDIIMSDLKGLAHIFTKHIDLDVLYIQSVVKKQQPGFCCRTSSLVK